MEKVHRNTLKMTVKQKVECPMLYHMITQSMHNLPHAATDLDNHPEEIQHCFNIP